jgi:error-prone DNA polymerase
MGFYPPRTIAEDAKRLGIRLLPVCVNHSEDRFSVEGGDIRIGLRLFRGMSEAALASILEARRQGRFTSLADFCHRTCVPRPVVEDLIAVGAFGFTGTSVPELMWTLAALPGGSIADRNGNHSARGLDFAESEHVEQLSGLEPQSAHTRAALELKLTGVTTGPHPFTYWRTRLQNLGVLSSTQLYTRRDGDRVKVAGIVCARARPPTKSGRTAIFISLEDEKGLVDTAVFEDTYQRCGRAIYESPVLLVGGRLSRQGKLDISVIADTITPLGGWDELPQARDDPLDVAVVFPSKNGGR